MKKFFILFAAVVLTAMSVDVFAQVSTGTNPAPGAKHNYFITDNGNTMLWWVTKGNLTTTTTDATITGPSAAATDITWAATVAKDDWYYVHILETDGAGCSNEKVLPVQIIESPFNLTLAAANGTQCYKGAVSVTLNGNSPEYDHGTAEIEFTVTPAGLSSSYIGYSFDLGIAYGSYTGLTETIAVTSSNASITGSTVTVTDNLPVTFVYIVDNTTKFTNATDPNGTAADFTATATISGGKAINGVSDNAGGTYTDNTSVARPHTSGIGTN
jgi:hypothetical protein